MTKLKVLNDKEALRQTIWSMRLIDNTKEKVLNSIGWYDLASGIKDLPTTRQYIDEIYIEGVYNPRQ